MQAVLDVNVIIAGLLAPHGTPAMLLRRWVRGDFEVVVSPHLLVELERALPYPKITKRIPPALAAEACELLAAAAVRAPDPEGDPPVRSADPGDDYLLALAAATRAVLVSGDHHLTDLADQLPVLSPAEFVSLLDRSAP